MIPGSHDSEKRSKAERHPLESGERGRDNRRTGFQYVELEEQIISEPQMIPTTITDELLNWVDIREKFRNKPNLGLLLGNGASQALWGKFAYSSLYEIACDPARQHPLTPVDQAFFNDMGTVNFEAVLSALATTKMVCGHLKKEYGDVDERYQSIRKSLIEAITAIHAPYERVPRKQKQSLGDILSNYRYIYSTNYDLLLYWAMMETKAKWKWKDFLWGNEQSFDASDAHEWSENARCVLYLHGALHLYHDLLGNTRKKVFREDDGTDLLAQFDVAGEWIPLFVSEGNSKDKLRSIRQNDYLSFAYWKLCYHRGPLVVFGSALEKDFDQHIIDAMRQWGKYDKWLWGKDAKPRQIAISLYPPVGSAEIIAAKNRLNEALREHDVFFFNSTTHPLSDRSLRIDAETVI
jgi:hypothetical protein